MWGRSKVGTWERRRMRTNWADVDAPCFLAKSAVWMKLIFLLIRNKCQRETRRRRNKGGVSCGTSKKIRKLTSHEIPSEGTEN